MNARLRRAARLIELAESAERSAKAKCALAERALAEARASAERAEAHWQTTARQPLQVARATDLEEHGAYLRALRTRADAAARGVEQAVTAERAASAEVTQTATERRKLEMWRDRMAEAERAEEARRERLANDELAARMVDRGRP